MMTINEIMKRNKLDERTLYNLQLTTNMSKTFLKEKNYQDLKSELRMQRATTRDALNTMLEYEQIENRPYYYKIHAPLILAFIDEYKTLINISCIAIKEIHKTKASELPRNCKKNSILQEMIEVQYDLIQCYTDLLHELYYILNLNKLELDDE